MQSVTAERLLQGDTVCTVMSPDTNVDLTAPDHIEGFVMNPCVVQETHMWGSTDTLIIGMDAGNRASGAPVHFFYTDMHNYFSVFNDLRHRTLADGTWTFGLAPQGRYKEHEFRATPDHHLVWEFTAGDADVAPLVEALERGRSLKFALQISPERWLVHHVAHAQQERDGSVTLMAPAAAIPGLLLGPRQDFDALPEPVRTNGARIQAGLWQAGVSISTNGWYMGTDGSNATFNFLALRVFEAI